MKETQTTYKPIITNEDFNKQAVALAKLVLGKRASPKTKLFVLELCGHALQAAKEKGISDAAEYVETHHANQVAKVHRERIAAGIRGLK